MAKRKFDSRALTRPIELALHVPRGDYNDVIQVLCAKASRLAGFAEGNTKELARAVADLSVQAAKDSDLRVRVSFSRAQFCIAMATHEDGELLLKSWEKKRAHRLMDEARLVGDPGCCELLLLKQLS